MGTSPDYATMCVVPLNSVNFYTIDKSISSFVHLNWFRQALKNPDVNVCCTV